MPRFRIAGSPRRVVSGTGWRAEFEGGTFESDREVEVEGLRAFARRFPEYRISEDDPDPPAQPDAPTAAEASDGQGPRDTEPRSRGGRGRGRAKPEATELQEVFDHAHEIGLLDDPHDAAEAIAGGVVDARIEQRDGETVLVEDVAGEDE